MKLLRTSAVLLAATAAAAAVMLATSAIDAVHPSAAAPMGRDGIESHEAGPDSWAPVSQMPSVAPSAASWVGVFNANWR